MRSRFSHLRRPVLYCHGHIHDNPVELISEPEFPGSKVICIAAPEFSRGFNIISIEFATTGAPLGCVVRSFRLSNRDGGVDVTAIRIPFYSATYANVRHQGCSILPKILAKLSEQETRFPDLLEALSMESGQSQLLSDALLEGEWLETLELTDKQEVFEHWIVRKVIR